MSATDEIDDKRCPECGEVLEEGLGHWVDAGDTFMQFPGGGFWTCAKFYGPDGRRINP